MLGIGRRYRGLKAVCANPSVLRRGGKPASNLDRPTGEEKANAVGPGEESAIEAVAIDSFKAIADPNKIIWVRPEDIVYKVTSNRSLRSSDVLSGDWDLQQLRLDSSAKHNAVEQHFRQGVEWEDTDLFKSIYAVRLARGESVHGAQSLAEMKLFYQKRYDRLFQSIRRQGFLHKADDKGQPVKVPHVHIGRDGEILFGRDGNHRLAMAKILAIGAIPCLVYARHVLWQEVRDLMTTIGEEGCRTRCRLWPHPDLADLSTQMQRK
jgi:hypothetical protein